MLSFIKWLPSLWMPVRKFDFSHKNNIHQFSQVWSSPSPLLLLFRSVFGSEQFLSLLKVSYYESRHRLRQNKYKREPRHRIRQNKNQWEHGSWGLRFKNDFQDASSNTTTPFQCLCIGPCCYQSLVDAAAADGVPEATIVNYLTGFSGGTNSALSVENTEILCEEAVEQNSTPLRNRGACKYNSINHFVAAS